MSHPPLSEFLVLKPGASFPVRNRFAGVALSLALLVIATSPGGLESDDAISRFETAVSWLDGRGGALGSDSEHAVTGKDGRKYTWYNLTQSLVLGSILWAVRGVHVPRAEQVTIFIYSLGFLSLLFVILGLLIRRVGVVMGAPPATGLVVLLVATPLLHYARNGQEENILAVCYAGILLGAALVYRGQGSGWVLIGSSCGLAVLTRVACVPTILAAYAILLKPWFTDLRSPEKRSSALLGLVPLIGAVAATAGWNWYRFGTPFESGYRFQMLRLGQPFIDLAGAPRRLMALLVSPARGIILYAPVLLVLPLALKAARALPEPGRRLVGFGLIAFLANLIFFSLFSIGDGQFGWGARYLVASLVFLAPLFLLAPWGMMSARLLVALSVLIQLASLVLPTNTEDRVWTIRRAAGQPCTAWAFQCSGLLLRPQLAAQAIVNAATNRPLPTIEQGALGSDEVALQASDYAAPSWWLVRIAYRMGVGTPRRALAVSLALLGLAFFLLWNGVRTVPNGQEALATGQ